MGVASGGFATSIQQLPERQCRGGPSSVIGSAGSHLSKAHYPVGEVADVDELNLTVRRRWSQDRAAARNPDGPIW